MRDIFYELSEAGKIRHDNENIQSDEIMYFANEIKLAADNQKAVYALICDIFDFGFVQGFKLCRNLDRARASREGKNRKAFNKQSSRRKERGVKLD